MLDVKGTQIEVRVGVIGAGYWGPNLVRTMSEIEGTRVVRVADLKPGRREFMEQRFPGVRTTADCDEVILDDDVDAVVIVSPPETHAELAMRALRAGKHVLIEKPMATCVKDAEIVLAEAQRCGRTLAVGHLFLYHPAVRMMRQLIDSGELGEILFLSSTRANLGPPSPKCDVLWDLAPHDVSIVLHLLGESPESVTARGASFNDDQLIETAYLNMQFSSGRMAQINVSWLTPNKTRRLELVCSKKTIVYDDMQPQYKLQIFEAGADNRRAAKDGEVIALSYGPGALSCPVLPNTETLKSECEDFVRCIRTGSEPVSSGRRAVETVRVLEAAALSISDSRRKKCAAGAQ